MQKRIQEEMRLAMKEGDTIKKETLRLILSEIKNEQIKLQRELKDSDIVKIIKRNLKSRQEAVELFKQGGRQDLIDNAQAEISILEAYLPKQLTKEELEKIITDTISELGATTPKDTGRVMKAIMSKYSSMVDGRIVQQIVSSKLSAQNRS